MDEGAISLGGTRCPGEDLKHHRFLFHAPVTCTLLETLHTSSDRRQGRSSRVESHLGPGHGTRVNPCNPAKVLASPFKLVNSSRATWLV